ncbi:hypothetical protein [Phenylobacterium kunshanense]|uniref:Uncharacterized protein n=1 Tax=Phenylobacterium kunshanense TaxID=1445034 RepID=A0A328BN08_9CAUL|nr:hypothetical protein [Phenylobacterium kunshanense]RAK67324.1 hypothetical protein DJ019_05185 [Phenylobacterium kunshanense]
MSYQLPVWVWPTVLMTVCAIAVWRGRDEERLAAAAELATWALTLVVFRARSDDTQWAVLIIDFSLLAVLLWIALRSRRYWPLFATGFQLLAVVTHLAHALDSTVSGWAYLTAALVFNYLTLLVVGYAAWTAPRYADTDDTPSAAPGATRR